MSANPNSPDRESWRELYTLISSLGEVFDVALQAFHPDSDDKAYTGATKKRLVNKALDGFKDGKRSAKILMETVKALEKASQQWQSHMAYASKSHHEMLGQLQSMTHELQETQERLRSVEAQRLAAVREAEVMRQAMSQTEGDRKSLEAAVRQRLEDLETANFSVHEAESNMFHMRSEIAELKRAAAAADERATLAAAALEAAHAEAEKAKGGAEKHQQMVARLTADNLVFLMQLRKAEGELAAAERDRAALTLAVEQQRGPWFDEVRASVEERVRRAMSTADALERKLEEASRAHAAQVAELGGQKGDLEEFVGQLRSKEEQLTAALEAATSAAADAKEQAAASKALADDMRRRLDDALGEGRAMQSTLKAMRAECTERYVNEQAAVGKVQGLKDEIDQLKASGAALQAQLAAAQRQLDTQTAVNRQLMQRKEEMEWELLEARTKLEGSRPPTGMAVTLSGMLQYKPGSTTAALGPPQTSSATAATRSGSSSPAAPAAAQAAAASSVPSSGAAAASPAPGAIRLAADFYQQASPTKSVPPTTTAAAAAAALAVKRPEPPSPPPPQLPQPAAAAAGSAGASAAPVSPSRPSVVSPAPVSPAPAIAPPPFAGYPASLALSPQAAAHPITQLTASAARGTGLSISAAAAAASASAPYSPSRRLSAPAGGSQQQQQTSGPTGSGYDVSGPIHPAIANFMRAVGLPQAPAGAVATTTLQPSSSRPSGQGASAGASIQQPAAASAIRRNVSWSDKVDVKIMSPRPSVDQVVVVGDLAQQQQQQAAAAAGSDLVVVGTTMPMAEAERGQPGQRRTAAAAFTTTSAPAGQDAAKQL